MKITIGIILSFVLLSGCSTQQCWERDVYEWNYDVDVDLPDTRYSVAGGYGLRGDIIREVERTLKFEEAYFEAIFDFDKSGHWKNPKITDSSHPEHEELFMKFFEAYNLRITPEVLSVDIEKREVIYRDFEADIEGVVMRVNLTARYRRWCGKSVWN